MKLQAIRCAMMAGGLAILSCFALPALWVQEASANPPASMDAYNSTAREAGKVVWQLDMDGPLARRSKLPAGAAWVQEGPDGKTCYRFAVSSNPAGSAGTSLGVTIPVDLKPYRGMIVSLQCLFKAQNVTRPKQTWNGLKCMLTFDSKLTGKQWCNEGNIYGSFDWRPSSTSIAVPEDADKAELILGMQDCTGTVWISDVKMTLVQGRPIKRPAPKENVPPPYKGHTLPRLRGVMSPPQFVEQDMADLAGWKANVIRWQMGRDWGNSGKDRDIQEYDRWLNGKLDELALVLDSAKQHGIKVVVDLHSPPGGRLADGTPCMLFEKVYQDHFIALWRRIATRFKGHPALWCYDLINEPVQNRPSPAGMADWYGIQVLAAKAIREIDPVTAISIETDGWDAPERFAWIEPVNLPNIIYQVHMYWPGQFTHQGVHNDWGVEGGDKRIDYPGKLEGQSLDKAMLRQKLQPVRDFQLAYNVHIYVGEFGAVRWAPGADRYLDDCISLFEEYGWDWTYHAYREWPGWSVEHADQPADRHHHPAADQPTARAKVLWKWFEMNQQAK